MDSLRLKSFFIGTLLLFLVSIWPGWRFMTGMTGEGVFTVVTAPVIVALFLGAVFALYKTVER